VTTFIDRLSSKLALTIGSASFSIEAHDIEQIDARMRPWGFEARVRFRVECDSDPSEDEVFAEFIKPDLIVASLTLGRSFDEPDEVASVMVLKGLVTDKAVVEEVVEEVAGAPVLTRRYTIDFADRARVLWGEHRPTALYVDATYKALFTDNLPTGITLAHSWTAATKQHPVLSLGLGVDGNLASYYDFVWWLLDRHDAGLFYDAAADSYKIADAKPSGGTALTLEQGEVAELEVLLPATRRAKVSVLNAYTDAAQKKKEGTNAKAVEGVRSDFLIRTPISADLDARSTLEASRANQRLAGARLSMVQFPTTPITPNAPVTFGDDFSSNLFVSGKSFRVRSIDLAALSTGDEAGIDAGASARYEMTYELELEQASDPVFHRPPFVPPRWPFEVEGKVVSEVGEKIEGTYQIYPDSATSLDFYKVTVPLFANKKVIVRYEPMTVSGHFYFPAYKDERVLIALDFDRASFAGYLDWRPGARLPLETQGNHILFGKKAASQTSMQHVYVDAKPVLSIVRTDDKDEQTIKILEGTIWMETKEND
jgi:hypothetical protein